MSYTYVNPFKAFGEMHNEGLDYVANNYNLSDNIESLASVILDFFETKTGIVESDFTRKTIIADLIESFNYSTINANPFFVSNTFTSVAKDGLDKIKDICVNGTPMSTVIAQLNGLSNQFQQASVKIRDYEVLLGSIDIAQSSASYWQNVTNNIGSTPWDPWMPPYGPNYSDAAPIWAAMDAIGYAVGWLRYSESHEGGDFVYEDCIKQAARTALLFSCAYVAFVVVVVLL